MRRTALMASCPLLFASFACDAGAPVAGPPPDGAPLVPGPACLVPSVDALDFGTALVGELVERQVSFASCDGDAVTVDAMAVPDDGDMLLAARLATGTGVVVPTFPLTLGPDDALTIIVTYRARASADDADVLRHLRLTGDSREVPELRGRSEVELFATPVTACPDDTCGGPSENAVGFHVGAFNGYAPRDEAHGESVPWSRRH